MMWIFLIILILILLLGLGIGNYFFNIALKRSSTWFKSKGHSQVNEAMQQPLETTIDKTMKEQYAIGQAFWDKYTIATPTFTSFDGLALKGKVIKSHPHTSKWVICMHGYRSNSFSDLAYPVVKFSEYGFNALVPDQRAHGDSEGEYIGMGWPERLDLLQWIDYLLKQEPDAEILLYGGSMGAATVMNASGENLPPNVKAIIADCGYTSAANEFAFILKNSMKLPKEPIIFFADIVTRLRAHYSLYGASCVKQLNKNHLPILFIHGTNDTFVPCSMTPLNANATKGAKEILYIEDATHFMSYVYNPEKYFTTVENFINKNFIA